MNRIYIRKTLLLLGLILSSTAAYPENSVDSIKNSIFGEAASEYGIDPSLLYAVALAESAKSRRGSMVGPWPLTLRTRTTPYYFDDKLTAEKKLTAIIEEGQNVDVGLMQINLKWHSHRVSDPLQLLDSFTNVRVGAAILDEALKSTDDIELGVGRYFNWKDESLSRTYGKNVLTIYKNIRNLQ